MPKIVGDYTLATVGDLSNALDSLPAFSPVIVFCNGEWVPLHVKAGNIPVRAANGCVQLGEGGDLWWSDVDAPESINSKKAETLEAMITGDVAVWGIEDAVAFGMAVAAAEREACAKICDKFAADDCGGYQTGSEVAVRIGSQIRMLEINCYEPEV